MNVTAIAAIVCASLITAGTAYWVDTGEPPRRPYPKPTPPPPASNVFEESKEPAPSPEDVERYIAERPEQLQREIERALKGNDGRQVEAVFTFLLPELLQIDPGRVETMVARAEGRAREVLIVEVARLWIGRDAHGAMQWMESLKAGAEQRLAAREAIDSVDSYDPHLARTIARRFDFRRDSVTARH